MFIAVNNAPEKGSSCSEGRRLTRCRGQKNQTEAESGNHSQAELLIGAMASQDRCPAEEYRILHRDGRKSNHDVETGPGPQAAAPTEPLSYAG